MSDIAPLSLVVLLGYSWPFFIQPHLIQYCGSGVIGLMPALVPLITIIISVPLLRVIPSFRQVAGVVGGLAFIMLLLVDGMQRSIDPWHLLLAITVPLSYALSNTLVKRVFFNVSPVMLTFLCLLVSSLLLTPFLLLEQDEALRRMAQSENVVKATLSAIWLGVFGTGLALLFFVVMLQQKGPLFAGMVTYIIPVIALAIGAMDGEAVSYTQAIALAGILSMVFMVQWPLKKKRVNDTGENALGP